MRILLSGFSQSKIDKFTFEALNNTHKAAAPIFCSLFTAIISLLRTFAQRRAALKPGVQEKLDSNPAADKAAASTEQEESCSQNRKLIAICALSMLAYAHSKNANLFQVIMGYHSFASGAKKHHMEPLHQIGCMVTYESMTRVLQANAQATAERIKKRLRQSNSLSFLTISTFIDIKEIKLRQTGGIL